MITSRMREGLTLVVVKGCVGGRIASSSRGSIDYTGRGRGRRLHVEGVPCQDIEEKVFNCPV